jgi:hypothetical protein
MYIRSQNKEELEDINKFSYVNDNGHYVTQRATDSYGFVKYMVLGKYKSKKRCLEVVDEIENRINHIEGWKEESEKLPDAVYQMPEK